MGPPLATSSRWLTKAVAPKERRRLSWVKLPLWKSTLTKERRTNRRLCTLIADLHEQILKNRHDLDVQFTRLAQLQAELDIMKAELRRDS